jgi:hypothetical protein
LPDGQFADPAVQPQLQKNFASPFTQIKIITRAVPPLSEGRFAIVKDVRGGMRWTLMVPTTNGA